jgi:hypothetical protein
VKFNLPTQSEGFEAVSPTVVYAGELTTVDDLVEALGGTNVVARLLGVGASAVSNWRSSGEVPKGWHLELSIAAQKIGHTISPIVFGVSLQAAE